MKITPEEVKHIAHLARLSLDQEELELYTGQLNDILDYMEKLKEVDTRDVEPSYNTLNITNSLREDISEKGLEKEEALKNALQRDGGYFTVPKVI